MSSSKSRLILIAVLGALALTGSAQAHGPASTTITIKGHNGDYYGSVKSPSVNKCLDQRTVTVYKQKGSRQNPALDTRIGSDT